MPITPADFQAQVTLRNANGLPADGVVNTYAFTNTGTGDPDQLVEAIIAMYEALPKFWSSSMLVGSNINVKLYGLSDPEPRTPLLDVNGAITGVGGTPLPAEVALCVSFAAAVDSGTPPARRRGRIFLGHLDDSLNSQLANQSRPDDSVLIQVALVFEDFMESLALVGWDWSVWSRADDSLFPVIRGWIDNSWDTQRRREVDPTARRTWGA